MADKLRKEEDQIAADDACELIELAIDELTLLTRAFDVISSACCPASAQEEEPDAEADEQPGLHLFH